MSRVCERLWGFCLNVPTAKIRPADTVFSRQAPSAGDDQVLHRNGREVLKTSFDGPPGRPP